MINFPVSTEYAAVKSSTYNSGTNTATGYLVKNGEKPVLASKWRNFLIGTQQLITWLEADEETPIVMPFATGYSDFTGFGGASYYRDRFKRVWIRGVVARTSGSSGLVATLPVGYRPAETRMYSINVYDGSVYRQTDLRVSTTGAITINILGGVPAAIVFAPLDGISFRVA